MPIPIPRTTFQARGAPPRRRLLVDPVEPLESRVVPAAVNLATLQGAAFAAIRDTISEGRRADVARLEFAPGTISDGGGPGILLSVSAVDDAGRVLPLRLMTAGGTPPGQVRQADGSVVVLADPHRPLHAVVRGQGGTPYRLFASLAGDVNGDLEVDAFDEALHDARFGDLAGAPATTLRRLPRHIAANRGVSVAPTALNLALGTRLVYDNDAQDGTAAVSTDVSAGTWRLMVGGQPFYAKGITGDIGYADPNEWTYDYLNAAVARSGANTLRTYGLGDATQQIANTSAALAWASRLSTAQAPMMILVGLYVPGVSAADLKRSVDAIAADANASHILGWCVGNETDPSTYPQIDEVAAYIKTKSTAPVMTAVPNVTTGALQAINRTMPNLDWLGINSFYGQFDPGHVQDIFLGRLDATMSDGTWTKPWAVTEYYSYDLPSPGFGSYAGMPSQVLNGTPYSLELNSTDNARNYSTSWTNFIESQQGKSNVGGFALNWMPPHNSQVPAYWKDMFVYRGAWQIFVNPYGTGTDRLQAVDAVTVAYGGTLPANATPKIVVTDGDPQGIVASYKATLTSPGTKVSAGQSLTASVTADDTDALTFDWYLTGGTTVTTTTSPGITGGPSTDPFSVYGPNAVTSSLLGHGTTTSLGSGRQQNALAFAMPPVPSGNTYQLRVIIRDGQGGAATASIGFAT